MRDEILTAYRAALAAVDPERCTRANLERRHLGHPGVWVAALGKAAPAMTRGAVDAAGDLFRSGIVVSDHGEQVPERCSLLLGSHPSPDGRSLTAGRALIEFARQVPSDGTLVVLVSGGGSALAEVPVPGLGIDGFAELSDELMRAGAPIEELNLVRRHLSQLKNGGLAGVTPARRLITLLISDVIDAPASTVASGPTLPDHTGVGDAAEVVRRRLDRDFPDPGPFGHRDHPNHEWEVIADCAVAARAAAASIGGVVWTETLRGESRHQAAEMVAACRQGEVLVAAGETTVTMSGSGHGGRNQEAALAAAIALQGSTGGFAALGTDGIDGPTDAAGAIVDGGTIGRMRAAGIDPDVHLANNDAYPALEASGDLVITGPSGTNVGDLWFALS